MSFPRYQKYRPSGVEWLGDVPEHWDIVPLKHLAEFINGDAFKPAEWAEAGVPIIRIQNLNGSDDFNYADGEVEERYLVHDGDLLFGWSGNRGTSFGPFLWRYHEVCALNQHIFRVVPWVTDKHSLFWTLKAVTAHVEDQAHGIIGMVHVTKGDLGSINVPVPSLTEQTHIAAFLDQETAKIDELVAEQRRLVELLKEKRQAVISHAVTKGLDPYAPMKPSGIEWLGEVPAHWQVRPIRSVAIVVRGASPRPAGDPRYFGGDAVPWVTVGEITKGAAMYVTETETFLTELGASHSKLFPKGTVIYSNSGATLGVPKILGIDACANDGVVAFLDLDRKVQPAFLCHYLSSITDCIRDKVRQGSGQPNLNTDIVKGLQFGLPPCDEQQAIILRIGELATQLDALTAEAQRAIDLLQERRTALISAAVTGQMDVRTVTAKGAA